MDHIEYNNNINNLKGDVIVMFPAEYLKMKTIGIIVIDGVRYERKTSTVAVGACDGETVETAELYENQWYTNVVGLDEFRI